MKIEKAVLLLLSITLTLASCVPLSDQIQGLVDTALPSEDDVLSRLPSADIDELIDTAPIPDSVIGISSHIHGFGMGSATFLRVVDIDQACAEMSTMGVRYVREEFPMANIQKSKFGTIYP